MTVRKEYNETLYNMGQNLRQIRKSIGLTMEDFAELCHLSLRTISNYENGKNFITIEGLILIYEGLASFYKSTSNSGLSRVDLSLTEFFEAIVVQAYKPTKIYDPYQ